MELFQKGYMTICDVNKSQRDNVELKKTKIIALIAVGLPVLGAIYITELAVTGGGGYISGIISWKIGTFITESSPRKWFGEHSALREAMERMKNSLKNGFGGEVGSSNNDATLPVDSFAAHDYTAPSPMNVKIATANTTAKPNNEASSAPEDTENLSDHATPTRNNTASTSDSSIIYTITSNGTAETNRVKATEFNSSNHLLQVTVNNIRNLSDFFLTNFYIIAIVLISILYAILE